MTITTIEGPEGGLVCAATDGETWQPPVIFVHADCGRRSQWRHAVAHLSGKRGSVTFDRRGHGESDLPKSGEFDHAACCADIDAITNGLAMEKFVLVGHSGGGALAYTYAATRPAHVAGLLLVDPPVDASVTPDEEWQTQLAALRGPSYADAISAYFASIAGTDVSVVDEVVHDARATLQPTIIGAVESASTFHPHDLADQYVGPRLSIVQSTFDGPTAIHRAGAGFTHTVVDGAGHWIQLTAAERFHALLDAFLAEVDMA